MFDEFEETDKTIRQTLREIAHLSRQLSIR